MHRLEREPGEEKLLTSEEVVFALFGCCFNALENCCDI